MGADATKKKPAEGDDSNEGKKPDDDQGKKPQDDGGQGDDDQNQDDDNSGGDEDLKDWEPGKVKDYVKKLRVENKDNRIAAKKAQTEIDQLKGGLKQALGIEDDSDVKPEDKIKNLQADNDNTKFRLACMEAAMENGITGEGVSYFEFLVQKKVGTLEEGEELDEDTLAEIAQQVKKSNGSESTTKKKTSTSTNGTTPNPGEGDETNLADFVKMTMVEKSAIYQKDPKKYQSLMDQAKEKRLIK